MGREVHIWRFYLKKAVSTHLDILRVSLRQARGEAQVTAREQVHSPVVHTTSNLIPSDDVDFTLLSYRHEQLFEAEGTRERIRIWVRALSRCNSSGKIPPMGVT